jgi:predicted glycosyltransferase involved in capsule biosynthesis
LKKINVIVSYRNRDVKLAKNCFESFKKQVFKDFQVVLVDYGSSDEYRKKIEELANSYSFVKYVYSYDEGRVWNRSRAMNIGIRESDCEYLLFADIDIVYSSNYLEMLWNKRAVDKSILNYVHYLRKDFTRIDGIIEGTYQINQNDYESIAKVTGASTFIKKSIIEEVGGYDEYYCFWGVEDRDLRNRLDKSGNKQEWLEVGESYLYHQWHEVVSVGKKNFLPDRWWDDMNIYFEINSDKIKRNGENWGKKTNKEERKVLSSKTKEFICDFVYKADFISKFVEELKKLSDRECLLIKIPKEVEIIHNKREDFVRKISNKLLKRFFPALQTVFKEKIVNEKDFQEQKDIKYVFWRLIINKKIISDYYISEDDEYEYIKMM